MTANDITGKTAAFTLLELLVALAILATAMAITLSTFYSITRAWQRGTAMADSLNRGEFAMEQIAVGLRSAFFPPPDTNAAAPAGDFGFQLTDNGSGEQARDIITWVKTGIELLPPEAKLQHGLHRVMLSIESDPDGEPALAARVWRPYTSLLDDFDPAGVEPFFVATRITGLDCRVSTNLEDNGWEWSDDWDGPATNTLPLAVEISLYFAPLEPGEPAVELKRAITIPIAPLSQTHTTMP